MRACRALASGQPNGRIFPRKSGNPERKSGRLLARECPLFREKFESKHLLHRALAERDQ
jgi:hypothetical protein